MLAAAAVAARRVLGSRRIDLEGRVVLLLGATRGFGLALAEELARRGARVALCGRDPRTVEAARRRLAAEGAEATVHRCDVTDAADLERLLEEVRGAWGPVDVLVHGASLMEVGPQAAMGQEVWERSLDVHLWAAWRAIRSVLPEMIARRSGRIVVINSLGGKVALPHTLPYSCGKFALRALAEGLRSELSGTGVDVVSIVPGLMRTGSQVNVCYHGQPEREATWFTLAGATPLTSMNARRAARRVVRAIETGPTERLLTWQARVLDTAHALAPGLVVGGLGLVNRLLPARPEWVLTAHGRHVTTALFPSAATGLVTAAARELGQYETSDPPAPRHAEQAGLTEDEFVRREGPPETWPPLVPDWNRRPAADS